MPVVFRQDGYRFHFFSDEGMPREPAHIHSTKDGQNAKFWLYPEVTLAYDYGFNARKLVALAEVVATRTHDIEEAWNDHFS